MRPSQVLKKLRNGEIVNCMKINTTDPKIVEVAALCGLDCVWLDTEHVPNDWATIENQIRAAKCHDMDTLVRVSRGSYSNLVKPLEADAAGIMVPHVMSAEDAQSIVRQTRFHPIGRRPLDGGGADGDYCMTDIKAYVEFANQQRFVALQIEDPEPTEALEAIAALDGIDMLFFGPGDFSHGLGTVGQLDHPKLIETRKRIPELARANGKFAGTVGGGEAGQELVDLGYQFLGIGADIVGLSHYFKESVAQFNGYSLADATAFSGGK